MPKYCNSLPYKNQLKLWSLEVGLEKNITSKFNFFFLNREVFKTDNEL